MNSLITQLNAILEQHSGTRTNGKVASERTKSARGEALRADFRRLNALGFKLQKPENLAEKHLEALCKAWYAENYSAKTIQGKLSFLRIFCGWIGKGDMVKNAQHYLPNVPSADLKVRTAAVSSKSWTANGIDIAEKVREADALDRRFGAMLRLALAFGLRRHEVIECYPWKVDGGDRFSAYRTKGGRPRDIYIDNEEQRRVLDYVKSLVKKSDHLGWPTKGDGSAADIKYNLAKWHKMLAKIGITKAMSNVCGHGLRAQYAENAALIANIVPPTLGGTNGQMPKEDLDLKRLKISELLGHSRPSITSAYFGAFGRDAELDAPDRTKNAIAAGVAAIPVDLLHDVPQERLEDCAALVAELAAARAYIDPRAAQTLWEHHSRRHATDWLQPRENNIASLEEAANHFANAIQTKVPA